MVYADSLWPVRSNPTRSSCSLARAPLIALTILRSTKLTTKAQATVTSVTLTWIQSCAGLP